MSDEISISPLRHMDHLRELVPLQRAVWGMQDVEVASPHTLRAIAHSGGCVIAAELAGRMIGFCTGFAALRDGELSLWSHMAGVHPDFQGRSIGFRLKQAQREWALAAGFQLMNWTFDPLQSGNANFNFNRLGVTARRYSVNHYGEMQDGINAGLASDRLEAQWRLDAPQPQPKQASPDGWKLVYVDEAGALQSRQPPVFDGERYSIEIPLDIAELKQHDIERAQEWQLHLRAAMTALLAAGYIVSAFVRAEGSAWYILSRES